MLHLLPVCAILLIAPIRAREKFVAEVEEERLKRVLQLRMRALGDPAQVLALIRSAAPFYRTIGGTGFRILQNVDDPAQILIEIEYAAHAALELNRHKVASDPMVRTFLQGWRAILAGSADMDVYEDVTELNPAP